MNQFHVSATSDRLWNLDPLLDFLIDNQHKSIELVSSPEAICLQNLGLYRLLDKFVFEQVNIRTWNPLEWHNRYNIISNGNNFWFKKKEIIDPDLHFWNCNKIFFCFFGRPTASRLGLGGYMYSNYPSITHLHFSATIDDDELMQFELDKLLAYRQASILEVGNMINQLPILLGSSDKYTDPIYGSKYKFNGYDYTDPLTNFYQDILIDIVVESHVAGNTFFPTEKTTRPIWLKKPFIIFASKDYLCYLRQMGFRTFSDFWDEDYDGYEGRERYLRILQLIDNIAKKSTSELNDMYCSMQYTLDHNYNLLQTQSYDVNKIEKII